LQKILTLPYDINGRKAIDLVQSLSILGGNPIYCIKNQRKINMYSLLGVLSLDLKYNDKVVFESTDEKKIEQLEYYFFHGNTN